MLYCYMASPIGDLLLAGDADSLCIIGFPEGKGRVEPGRDWIESDARFSEERQQLAEYFEGKRQVFSLTLSPTGTVFQRQVLDALQEIPFGRTCSYRDIAERIGRPKAVRAVGAANGRNPIPIVIPCHRVIGADGSLTGFGGGLAAKSWLLSHEGCSPGSQETLF
ncbi:MAG: methylated-DNA-[protein]-cysteine S-methyltransferase [Candidatus Azotimanducaceae bacterium]|jgi:methylated-DNA-[protein]-cysteine S-methyltransferase